MGLLSFVGTAAAICTTAAYIPQIIKIRKRGGGDLSYSMLFVYLTGTLLWLVYGLILRAAAIIWANALTSLLVLLALAMKMYYSARKGAAGGQVPGATDSM
jgi:MtN3 and saliva related transmembrane protein